MLGYNGGMKPRVHALRCSMRDSHAKCVKIYHRPSQFPVEIKGFRRKLHMAPSLLVRRIGHGRIQPFDPGTAKNVTQAAEVRLCSAARDRGVISCTQVPITNSYRAPLIHFWRRQAAFLRQPLQRREINRTFSAIQRIFSMRKILGKYIKKALGLDE